MSEEEKNSQQNQSEKESDKVFEANPEDLKKIPSTLYHFFISIFSFKQDKDVNPIAVSEAIEKSVEFKGYNVWVLICSILIASIGLNMNSVAVVIGAMLISPLMGPIRGIGLAVGTNNFKLLLFSLTNFGVATGVSVLFSFLYFLLTPFKEVTPEIFARTEPLILDVLIASFGGLAGIIAAAKNDNSTVLPGVAIATALMPPLCVSGYGLATGNWNYFLGASYLFVLNSIFICLTTILVIRYLKFPLKSYLNKKKERKIKIYILAFLLIILIPSGIKFAQVWSKSIFNANIERFITNEINPIGETNGFSIVSKNTEYSSDSQSLTLSIVGNGRISDLRIEELRKKLHEIEPDCELKINQNKIPDNQLTPEYFNNVIGNYNKLLTEKDKEIDELNKKINSNTGHKFDMEKTEKWLRFQENFKALKSFSASNAYEIKMNNKIDTVLLFRADWNDSILNPVRTKKLNDFIKIEFNTNDFELIETTN